MNFKDFIKEKFTEKNVALAGGLVISLTSAYLIFSKRGRIVKPISDSSKSNTYPISKAVAELWRENLSKIAYKLELFLPIENEYEGYVIISFDMKTVFNEIYLPFQGGQILECIVNGDDFTAAEKLFEDQKINLKRQWLVEGRNVIQIKFRNRYNNDGYGLSKIKDRDGEEYIYSNCEPCGMHTIFPCFDLIFVRAIFTLTIICDKNFKAISNEILLNSYDFNNSVTNFNVGPETKSKEINYKIHHFHETKPIPEYIFTFACGNYFEIKNNTTFEGCPKLPSSLYIKQSLRTYLDSQSSELFQQIYYGLKFFEEYTGYKYPFSKYDQLIVPEYPSCAMENPGCVTMDDEAFIFRETPTWQQEIRRAYIVLHEMAHMWFGDLINLKWYDGMWLKESFASFLGYLCLIESPYFKAKYPRAKEHLEMYEEPGIILDQFEDMNHGIMNLQIRDTIEALCSYDDIIYHKGCSVLNVLNSRVGKENMKKFIQQFVRELAFSPIDGQTFEDYFTQFLPNLKIPHDFNPHEFIHGWLKSKGTDMVRVASNEKGFLGFNLVRNGREGRRDHKIRICLLKKESSETLNFEIHFPTDVSTVWTEFKTEDFDIILPNYGGNDYIITKLDDSTIDFCLKNPLKLRQIDPYLEYFFWRKFTLMITLKETPASKIYDVIPFLKQELISSSPYANDIVNRIKGCLQKIESPILGKLEKFLFENVFQEQDNQNLDHILDILINNFDSSNANKLHKWLFSESMILRPNKAKRFIMRAVGELSFEEIGSVVSNYPIGELIDENIHRIQKVINMAKTIHPITLEYLIQLSSQLTLREIKLLISLLKTAKQDYFNDIKYPRTYLEFLSKLYPSVSTKKFFSLIEALSPTLTQLAQNKEMMKEKIKDPHTEFLITYFLKERLNHVEFFLQKEAL